MGVVAYCRNCNTDLFEVPRELVAGDFIQAKFFRALDGVAQPRDGDATVCPVCDSDFRFASATPLMGFRPKRG